MFFLDAHVHFYDFYSLKDFLSATYSNFENIKKIHKNNESSLDSKINSIGIILTERNDCNFYSKLINDKSLESELKNLGFSKNKNILTPNSELPELVFFPGRQCSSSERIEVLALFYEDKLPEYLSFNMLINHIEESGAIPVINWAPGKWLGRRGKIISEFLEENYQSEKYLKALLGITTLLPKELCFPKIIRKFNKTPIIAGSDPLPLVNEEKLVGSFGMLFEEISTIPSSEYLKSLIYENNAKIIGNRSNLLGTFHRVLKNQINKIP